MKKDYAIDFLVTFVVSSFTYAFGRILFGDNFGFGYLCGIGATCTTFILKIKRKAEVDEKD